MILGTSSGLQGDTLPREVPLKQRDLYPPQWVWKVHDTCQNGWANVSPGQFPLVSRPAVEDMDEYGSLHHPCIAYLGITLLTFFMFQAGDKDIAMS